MKISDVINLTVNVNCKLCSHSCVYAMGSVELASREAANHIFRTHKEILLDDPKLQEKA